MKNMCPKADTLFRTHSGNVRYCSATENFTVIFGNVLLSTDIEGLLKFNEFAHAVELQNFNHICWNNRFIVMKMPARINVLFSKNEVLELRELLTNAIGIYTTLETATELIKPLNP